MVIFLLSLQVIFRFQQDELDILNLLLLVRILLLELLNLVQHLSDGDLSHLECLLLPVLLHYYYLTLVVTIKLQLLLDFNQFFLSDCYLLIELCMQLFFLLQFIVQLR